MRPFSGGRRLVDLASALLPGHQLGRDGRDSSIRRPIRLLSLVPVFPFHPAPSGGPGRSPLIGFLSPSAFTGRVALSGAASIRTIPLRRCGSFQASQPGPIGMGLPAAARPCGFSLLRRLEDPRPIVLSDGRSLWIVCASARPATGHASPVCFSRPRGDVPLPALASPSRPGRNAIINGDRTPLEARISATLMGSCPSQCCSCP